MSIILLVKNANYVRSGVLVCFYFKPASHYCRTIFYDNIQPASYYYMTMLYDNTLLH